MFISAKSFEAQSKVEFEEFDLDNGLHVILHKDGTNPIVSVNLWYHVGAKDEDSNRTGFAHLFEHMMFQGSENVGKAQHFEYIQKAGGTLNGTTNQDRTNYFETAPSNQLELLLWLESDRMSTLKVNKENFDNQREVVKEEKRQRYDNAPYGSRWGELMKRAFKNQTYEWIPIGSMEDLNGADLSYAQEFYKKYYSPDNAVLVVSGDINYDEAKELVIKYFGGLKSSNAKKKTYKEIIFNQGEIKDVIYDNVQLPAVYFGYKIPGAANKDIYALEVISMILTDGKSSRLYKGIVYEKKIAKQINSFVWDNELGGMLIISATGFKNSNPDEIDKEITLQVNKLMSEEVLDKELEKVKNSIENDFLTNLQTTMRKADLLAHFWTYFKKTELINTAIDYYLNVTGEDIINTAKKYLNPDNRVILYYLPKKENKVN
ncbi:MAG: insulinase family protein [Chlorobi bacterium]|nr:insulinase family protein [Chlorobiota bacterium]